MTAVDGGFKGPARNRIVIRSLRVFVSSSVDFLPTPQLLSRDTNHVPRSGTSLADLTMAEDRRRRSGDILVLLKTADILEAMAATGRPLGHSEIARLTGLNKTTSHRILATLLSPAILSSRVRISGTTSAFVCSRSVTRCVQRCHGGSASCRSLDSFADRERGRRCTFFAVREGRKAVCLDRIEGKYASSLVWQLGENLPLHVGAAPRVLLAELSEEELNDYLARELEAMTAMTIL